MIDLDDTSNCPLGATCSCGNTEELGVVTVGTLVGVFCLTICEACIQFEQDIPGFSAARAIRASLEHCVHLGITADQMAEVMNDRD